MIYDAGMPGLVGPTVINNYSVLGITPYWRAMNFISVNMASFPRSVQKDSVDQKHPLDFIIKHNPNPWQNGFDFWKTLFFHWRHYGNGFARIRRDALFKIAGFENLRPEFVIPFVFEPDKDSTDWQSRQLWYFLTGGSYKEVVPAADVIHLQGLSYDGLAGFNPIFLMSESFERARGVRRFITKFLTKGTLLRGSIEIPTGVSADQQKALIDTLRSNFTGPESDRDVIVLSDGAKLSNATLSPDQSKLIDLTNFTTKEVSQITGVPPVFLFDNSEAKYNNTVEQAWDMVNRDLFRPLLEATESELNRKLLSPAEQAAGLKMFFDTAALTRGDTAATTTRAVSLVGAGIWTPNDGRKSVGSQPSDDPTANKLERSGSTQTKPKEATNEKNDTEPSGQE